MQINTALQRYPGAASNRMRSEHLVVSRKYEMRRNIHPPTGREGLKSRVSHAPMARCPNNGRLDNKNFVRGIRSVVPNQMSITSYNRMN